MDDGPKKTVPLVEADAAVSRVTFFEDRAEVVRVARCRVPKGRALVRAGALTVLVDDRSFRSSVGGDASVEIVSHRIQRRAEEKTSSIDLSALEAELEDARDRFACSERALENARARTRHVATMMSRWASVVASVPSRVDSAAEELGRAYDQLEAEELRSLDTIAACRKEREDARQEVAAANRRLAGARAKKPRFEAFAEIEVVSSAESEIVLELRYRTPCALFRPEHLARLIRNADGSAEIAISTFAVVWQLTGEKWQDVACRFSTSRPARSAEAPPLREDVLVTRRKTELERKQIVVEAHEQTISLAGAPRSARDVDEMPGVDDGGEAQWFDALARATIESDGRPVRIPVSERRFPCIVARVCFPEREPVAHLRAKATLAGASPLLAGPVVLGREREIVGRSTVPFVSVGETFELGFGVDDGVRVRRRVKEKRKTTSMTGTQHVSREVTLYVSNLSGRGRALSIVERVPVSEIEDVVVQLEQQPRLHYDARDGFVTFEVEIPPRATRDFTIEYRIEAKPHVMLPVSFDA